MIKDTSYMFLTGPGVVKTVTGETVTPDCFIDTQTERATDSDSVALSVLFKSCIYALSHRIGDRQLVVCIRTV